jgi:hypothetical protein
MNEEMKTIMQDLRDMIAYEIERNYLPICVCGRCGNEIEGALVNRIIQTIKTGVTE